MIIGIEASHANKPQRTGVEEYCFQVIQHLKKIIPATERVILYSNESLRGELGVVPAHWEVRVLSWPLKKLWSQTRLSWELFRRPPDIFFAPGQLLPVGAPKRSAVMVHDSAFLVFPRAYNTLGRWYLRLMNWWIVQKSALILTSTTFNVRELHRLYPRTQQKKIVITPLGFQDVIHASQQDEGDTTLRHYGITKPYILSIGRLEEKKNTVRIIEAFDELKKQHDIQLVLVGMPGVGYEMVKRATEKSLYQSDIICPGYVQSGELAPLLRGARAFIFPSLYEGFGIPVLEAFAAGCPVIASQGNALEEVGGAAALYADPMSVQDIAAQVSRVLGDRRLSEEMVQKGFVRLAEFSWEKTASLTWNHIVKNLGS